MDTSVNIVIGGEAGQGLVTLGGLLARSLVRAGYEIVVTQDYMSRIRGGHNTYAIRTDGRPVLGPTTAIDLLVCLDPQTLTLHRDQLSERGLVLAGEGIDLQGTPGLSIPYKTLCPKPIFENTAALGVLARLLCLDLVWLEELLEGAFHKKGDEVAAANRTVLSAAHAWAEAQDATFTCLSAPAGGSRRMFLNGNEAIALGAMAAGVNFCSFYPMTPATSLSAALIAHAQALGVLVEQAEDEIAAVNMAIGASYAGARVLVPTSGGGFSLMVEGVSLAGMTETPLVIALAMRPGPATGLPTRTEQADLNLALYAGHGEFPRAILAPGTPEQCFALAHRAVCLAERWQTPVFVLTDQFLADSYRAVLPFDLDALPEVPAPGLTCREPAEYRRYALTESGVSPRLVPGFGEHLVVLDSDEHTPDGHLTEDLDVRVVMVDKRQRKMRGLLAETLAPDVSGDSEPEVLLVCWGSTLGAALEAAAGLRDGGTPAAVMHFTQVYPLDPKTFLPALAGAKRAVMVEGNHGGQLARLIRQETGFAFAEVITRYDGLPITADFILDRLSPKTRIPA